LPEHSDIKMRLWLIAYSASAPCAHSTHQVLLLVIAYDRMQPISPSRGVRKYTTLHLHWLQ